MLQGASRDAGTDVRLNDSASLKSVKSSWGCCRSEVPLYSELTTSVTRRDGDDAIIIFGEARVWAVQKWSHNMTDTKTREFSADLQI